VAQPTELKTVKTVPPVPAQDPIPEWLRNQFDQIEELQLQIVHQQSEIEAALDEVSAQSTIIWAKVQDLGALCNNDVIPELEAAIKATAKQAESIDQKVPDEPVPAPDQRRRGLEFGSHK
jgi:hypothetical protein